MRLQLLSDLHLETETFVARPTPGAELLVLAGDIDAGWDGLAQFADWPVPVLMVAGNHEFDGRDLHEAWPALRARCQSLGIRLLECESLILTSAAGLRVRFLGTVRWCDFALFGAAQQARAERAGAYFLKLMNARRDGAVLDVEGMKAEAHACRDWLAGALALPALGRWDSTVAITHFAPSLRSLDPRFGTQPGTASFCNADDLLIPQAELWLHGHLHCRHDYRVDRPGRSPTRVVSQAVGLARKGEAIGFDAEKLIDVPGMPIAHVQDRTRAC